MMSSLTGERMHVRCVEKCVHYRDRLLVCVCVCVCVHVYALL